MSAMRAARSTELVASFHSSIVTVVPELGSTTVPLLDTTVSATRSSTSGENAVDFAGNAIEQWFVPQTVTVPFVIGAGAIDVFTMRSSSVIANWSKMRFAGTHASRYRAGPRSVKPKLKARRGPGDHVVAG